MAASPGPTRVINIYDDPPGGEDTSYQELPPPPHLSLPVALGNYHWEEELRSLLSRRFMDYAGRKTKFRWDWFGMDEMEKGLLEEKDKVHNDQGKDREHSLKDHTTTARPMSPTFRVIDRFRQSVSSLAAGFLGRAPQNTQQDCLLTGSYSPTGDYDSSVNSLEQNRDIVVKDGNLSEVSMALLEDSSGLGRPVLGLMNQRYAEVIVSSSRLPAFARNTLSEVWSSDDTSYGSPSSSRSIALLLEKAILNWSAAPRYVGLYPHSADPPIHITKIVAEYPSSPNRHRKITNALSFARPARLHNRSYHHHHHHHHHRRRSLRGAHTAPKLAGSLLTSVLQAIKAFGSIILTALFKVPLIGRIYKKIVPTRYRTSDLNKHLKLTITSTKTDPGTPALRIMETPTLECNALSLDPEFQEWLNEENIDLSEYNFDEGIGNITASTPPAEEAHLDPAYITDLTQLAHPELAYSPIAYFPDQLVDIDPSYITNFSQLPHPEPAPTIDYNQHFATVGNHHLPFSPVNIFDQSGVPFIFPDNLSYNPPPPAYETNPEPDWQNFVNLSGSSTPSSSVHTDFDSMEVSYMGATPGLSIPTSQNVTPQTEGLETPTFTPSCSPLSVTSPPQPLPPLRRYACENESCGHKEFDRPCDLNKHLKTHNKHLACDFEPNGGCQMRFSTEKDRKRHRETVHEKKRPYVCHICVREGAEGKEGRFSRKDNLRIHRKKVHGAD